MPHDRIPGHPLRRKWIEPSLIPEPTTPGIWYIRRGWVLNRQASYSPWCGSEGNARGRAAKLTRKTGIEHTVHQVPRVS
jgi:hypothetical protein